MMRYRKLSLLALALLVSVLLLPAQSATAQVGNCEPAIGEAFLDINNVRARITNNGNLFWRGSPAVYEVPKGGGESTIFTSGVWIAGQVGGELRAAAARYGSYEFWAGPLDDQGNPPADCSEWDRVWKVSKEDVVAYEGTGSTTPDLLDWPTGLGAPTLDADGNLIDLTSLPLAERIDRKINLGAGERPEVLGDQMLWMIMNDMGNVHNATDAQPVGLEVHASAFAFNTSGAIGNTTFYKWKMFYKGTVPLEDAYMGLFSDPDLGNFDDDYIGSDTTLGLGYVYNADDDDEGHYGAAPPATGYDFFQGPLVADNGIDDDEDGVIDEEDERLKMTTFTYFNNSGNVQGDPTTGVEYYNFMRARWKDGQRFTFGGDGRSFSNIPTNFVYPGEPSSGGFWTEFNADGAGTANTPADRRFVMSSGPFTINPGDQQEVVYGIIWSRGDDHLDSVAKMKQEDALAQAVFDIDFQLPAPPEAPIVTATPLDGKVILTWGYTPNSNNYLDSYNVIDPLLSDDITDRDYVFEGYNVYRYADSQDQVGELIATYDVVNGVTRVIEGTELTFVTAEGNDTGIEHSHVIEGLTNYTTYEFGVQAYAYNATSSQKVYASPISLGRNRLQVQPARIDARDGGSVLASDRGADFDLTLVSDIPSDGSASASIVDPSQVTGDDYQVAFKDVELLDADGNVTDHVVAYDIINTTTGELVFDGTEAARAINAQPPQGDNVVVVDGLEFSIRGPQPEFTDFMVVANADGPLAEPAGASSDWQSYPGIGRATNGGQPQQVNGSTWHISTGGQRPSYAEFVSRTTRDGARWGATVPFDYEIRFTGNSSKCLIPDAFGHPRSLLVDMPFELWNVGIGTFDDPSDDVRMFCHLVDEDGNEEFNLQDVDHPGSGASNDPYTDWFYWVLPTDASAGQAGYDSCISLFENDITTAWNDASCTGTRVMDRMVLFNWNGGDVAAGVYDQEMPEVGTVFRITTSKPNGPGVVFEFSTDGFGVQTNDVATAEFALDQIGIVPNPYKGVSAYEVSQLVDEVRFTNLPEQATIRVFTLNGSLLRTMVKNSPQNSLSWDLTTDENLPLSSGMYLVHVEVPGQGEKVIKFGVIKKRIQLNAF